MRYLLITAMACVFSTQVFAFGATANFFGDLATSGSTAGTSGSSASTDTTKKDKIIEQAQNDAATFVASKGQVRGIYLEAALYHLRHNYQMTNTATDLELAQAILAR